MKKFLMCCTLILLLYFIPTENQASQVSAFTNEDTSVYLTQQDAIDSENTVFITAEQDTPTNNDEESDLVLIPIFLVLTVIIGVLLYNFMVNRED